MGGGVIEDYLEIHELLDSPKATMNNNTARTLTHQTWFVFEIIPKIFGYDIITSKGRCVPTVDIALLHISEDFRNQGVPTVQDYFENLVVRGWMNNGVEPIPSIQKQKELR